MTPRPRILVAIPVLQRPANAQPVIDSLTESDANVRAVFVCSPGDRQQVAACEKTGTETLVTTHPPIKGDFAHKMNLAYRESSEPWIFQAADDIRFEAGWDKALLRTAKETGAKVIGTQDGGNPSVKRGIHSTHTLIARSYIDDPGASMDGPGSVFSSAYGHQFCDVELVELAMARGVWAFCADAYVLHDHPFWQPGGRGPLDATYRKGQATARDDQRMYQRRRRMWATMKRP